MFRLYSHTMPIATLCSGSHLRDFGRLNLNIHTSADILRKVITYIINSPTADSCIDRTINLVLLIILHFDYSNTHTHTFDLQFQLRL